MVFAEKFKKYRTEKGYSQQIVADLLALDRSTIAHYEKGDSTPNLENLIRICNIFEITPNDLLCDIN